MKEELENLIRAIHIAQKRGTYSLEESAIIYQCLKGLNHCPVCNPPKEKDDIVMLDKEDKKLDTIPE